MYWRGDRRKRREIRTSERTWNAASPFRAGLDMSRGYGE